MIKVAVCGALGRMGTEVCNAVKESDGMTLSAQIDIAGDCYKTIEDAMIKAFNVLVVLCECDTEIILERLRNANEELPEQLRKVDKVKKAFREEVERSFINYVVIDTTNKEIDECVDSIITRVMEMEKVYGKEYNCV